MAIPRTGEAALFFTGILAAGRGELALAAEVLAGEFGPAFLGSAVWRFTQTDYYVRELGPEPLRAFLAWPGFFDTAGLAERKLITNRMEIELARRLGGGLPRPVNLDPGYLTPAKLILASAKNFAHRIHLRDGIYAEATLLYGKGEFRSLPWTFPDYRAERYHGFFLAMRRELMGAVQEAEARQCR